LGLNGPHAINNGQGSGFGAHQHRPYNGAINENIENDLSIRAGPQGPHIRIMRIFLDQMFGFA
jgi:hypothetical protein